MFGKFITRAEIPNVKKLMEQFAPTRPVKLNFDTASSVLAAETVLDSIIIPGNSWRDGDGFKVENTGFFIGNTTLTSFSYRIRLVDSVNNNTLFTITKAPGAAALFRFYTFGLLGRFNSNSLNFSFVPIFNGVGEDVFRNTITPVDFTQDITIQITAQIAGTLITASSEQLIAIKHSKFPL